MKLLKVNYIFYKQTQLEPLVWLDFDLVKGMIYKIYLEYICIGLLMDK